VSAENFIRELSNSVASKPQDEADELSLTSVASKVTLSSRNKKKRGYEYLGVTLNTHTLVGALEVNVYDSHVET
jgi:hypothetical protein